MRSLLLLAVALGVLGCRSPCPDIPKPYQIFCQNGNDRFDECYDKCIAAGLPQDTCFERCNTNAPKPRRNLQALRWD